MSDERKSEVHGTLSCRIKEFVTGEVFSYLFFGVCTTVVNIVVFQTCCSVMGIHALVSNIFAWIFAVAFAYVINNYWVFLKGNEGAARETVKILKFTVARIATYVIEAAGIYFFIYSRITVLPKFIIKEYI